MIVAIRCFRSYLCATKSLASQSSTAGLHGLPSISSEFGDDAVAEQPGPDPVDDRARHPAVARIGEDRRDGRAPVVQRRRWRRAVRARDRRTTARRTRRARCRSDTAAASGSGEKYAASPYASFSFHLLTKLSWQALHLKLTPRNACAVFCDACIHGVTAALVSPRQLTPMRNPSGSPGCAGLSSLRDELVVRHVVDQRRQQPLGDALAAVLLGEIRRGRPRCAAGRSRTKSSARRTSCRRRAASATRRSRLSGAASATNACSSSGGGSSPQMSR